MANILVVDDSVDVLRQLEHLLRDAGHRVVATPYARVALSCLSQQSVDLVFTDIYMPDVDGFELLKQMRRWHPGVPVIAMSADPREFDVLGAATLLGAVRALWKPFASDDVLSAIDGVLRAKRA